MIQYSYVLNTEKGYESIKGEIDLNKKGSFEYFLAKLMFKSNEDNTTITNFVYKSVLDVDEPNECLKKAAIKYKELTEGFPAEKINEVESIKEYLLDKGFINKSDNANSYVIHQADKIKLLQVSKVALTDGVYQASHSGYEIKFFTDDRDIGFWKTHHGIRGIRALEVAVINGEMYDLTKMVNKMINNHLVEKEKLKPKYTTEGVGLPKAIKNYLIEKKILNKDNINGDNWNELTYVSFYCQKLPLAKGYTVNLMNGVYLAGYSGNTIKIYIDGKNYEPYKTKDSVKGIIRLNIAVVNGELYYIDK